MLRALRALGLVLWLAAATPVPAAAQSDEQLAAWREQLDRAEAEVANARQRAAAAEAAYVNMRHDRSIRGSEKSEIIAALGEAKRELADAEANLAVMREETRREGAPAQWTVPDPPAEAAD
jgi:septal ring factor EnvC (AmiA/AmiB activator)